MIKWEKVLQVKARKIKQQVIKPVEDAAGIPFIVESDFVLIADLEKLRNCESRAGETDIMHLMEIKGFIDKFLNFYLVRNN